MNIDNRRDILLLLLYTPGALHEVNVPIVGRTKLVKMLFIFREEVLPQFKRNTKLDDKEFYDFAPWNFGPFSEDVYDDLRFFKLREFISIQKTKEETVIESAEEWALWASSANSIDNDNQFSEYDEDAFSLTPKGCGFVKSKLVPLLSNNQKKLLYNFRKKFEYVSLRAILKYVYDTYPEQCINSKIRDEITGA